MRSFWKQARGTVLFFLGALIILLWTRLQSYLLFHSLVELFSIVIACTIFIVLWNARRLVTNPAIQGLGITFLISGLLDLLHTLAFRGMGVFPGTGLQDPAGANLATQLWLAARYSQAMGLLLVLVVARVIHRKTKPAGEERISLLLLAGGLAWMVLLLLSIFRWHIFPDAYVGGLTGFKIVSEYIIIGLFAVAGFLLWRFSYGIDEEVRGAMLVAISLMIAAEIAFTVYQGVTDVLNFSGHILKVAAYIFVHSAALDTVFRKPTDFLFRELTARERALRESELTARERADQLSTIMDTVPAIVWITNDTHSAEVRGNIAASQMLRMSSHDNQSKTAPDGAAPDHFRIYQNGVEINPEDLPLQRSAATGQPLRDFQETLVFNDGSTVHLLGNVSPLLDPEGNPAGAVAAFIDITRRVQAERALQESEQRYRSLFETISESFALHEILYDDAGQAVDHKFMEVNPAFERMTGLQRADVIGKSWRQISPDHDLWLEALRTVKETGETRRMYIFEPLIEKHLDVLMFRTDTNLVATLIVDVTEQYRSNQALRATEAQLRRLIDSNIIGVVFFDPRGEITLANDAFLRITGYSRADIDARLVNWQTLTPSEFQSLDSEHVADAGINGTVRPYEKEYIRRDGTRVPILIGYATTSEDSARFICFIVDLTEQKNAQEEARQYSERLEISNHELEEFAFVASHDMQEPLRKIQAFGERLKVMVDKNADPTSIDYLERMLSASRRMRGMIDDLLSLSRVTTRGQPFVPVDLNLIAENVLSDLELRVEMTRARVTVEDLPVIEADPTQMHQLLLNLIGNALKFHRPDQPPVVHVRCSIQEAGEWAELSVADEGIGLEQEFSERIFQPFQRLHGRMEYEGSGIGLAVCKKIVQRHGGEITVQSQPGAGAVFTVLLPMRQTLRSKLPNAKSI